MRRGFTLIEILVCVGIVTILIAVMVPVITNSKRDAYKTSCASNLHSVGQAVRMYVDDNDSFWPPSRVWSGWNQQTSIKLANCPLTNIPSDRLQEMEVRGRVTGYAYNQDLFAWNESVRFVNGGVIASTPPTGDRDIPYPASTVAFFDAAFDRTLAYAPDPNFRSSPYPYDEQRGWERHNGGANYLLCDGHVKWLTANQVRPGLPHLNDGTMPAFSLQTKSD